MQVQCLFACEDYAFFFFLMEKKKSVNNAIWLQVHKYIGAATENRATAECLFEMCVAYKPCNS